MGRGIEQIAVAVAADGDATVLALASDGTLWSGYFVKQKIRWELATPIPQPGEEEPTT